MNRTPNKKHSQQQRPRNQNCIAAGMESDSDDEFDCYYSPSVSSASKTTNLNHDDVVIEKQTTFSKENIENDDDSGIEQRKNNDIKDTSEREKFDERLNFEDDKTETNHWRKYRFHQSLPVPLDDFRLAVMQGNLPVVKSLIEQGIEADTILKSGWTALMYSCSCGHSELTDYLLIQKCDPNFHKERFTPLMAACGSSKEQEDRLLKCVESLIKYEADVNAYERHHVTPLMFAAREGRLKIVKVLLENKADLNFMDNRGWTALTWAISRGHGSLVRILLQSNAETNDIKQSGQPLVNFAQEQGQNTIAKMLEKYVETNTIPEESELASVVVDIETKRGLEKPFLPKPKLTSMHYGDLEMFLSGLSLTHLIPVFHAHALYYTDILKMNDEDLEKIGIDKLGWRKLILQGIRDVHRKEWQETSLQNLRDKKYISCPDAVCMIANIGKHLSYIQTTIGYLRDQIQVKPRILELGQETNSVRTMLQRIEDAMKNNHNLHDELRFLKLHLDKIQDNVEYVPADLIVEKKQSSASDMLPFKARFFRRPSICATTIILAAAIIGGTTAWKNQITLDKYISMTWKLF